MTKPAKKAARAGNDAFTAQDWSDIHDALWDAANVHHSGPKAERIEALARKIRTEMIA